MPVNTQITAALQANDVPPDQQCVPGLMTELLAKIAAYMSVVSSTSQTSGGSGDSVAQQALQQAAIALSTANQALAAAPNRRTSGTAIPIATGDSTLSISWSPAFPDLDYEIRLTYVGTAVFPASYFAFFVEEGTKTVNGCTLRLNNSPANFKITWVAEQI